MYHPSQQIEAKHEALYSKAIFQSLCESPAMIGNLPESSAYSLQAVTLPNLTQLNFNQKLGHLYEDAFYYLLQLDNSPKVLSKNLQLITAEKQTIGELDFLLWNAAEKIYHHLEVAVKFYLILKTSNGYRFPGPDARDNYQRKLDRMRSHQLTLTKRAEVQEQIASLTDNQEIHVHHCVQGIFFDHIHATEKPTPEYANPSCTRRTWLHCRELEKLTDTYKVIPKPLWLCSISEELYDTLVSVTHEELIELAQQRCTMFMASANAEPQFLAPDSWPNG